jgi:hypothetical protein
MNIEETEQIRATLKITYEPSPENQEWLNWLLEAVKALPYEASSRWAFYHAFQLKPDTFPAQKEKPKKFKGTDAEWKIEAEKQRKKHAYKGKFLSTTSKARHSFWNGWSPDTLSDDTRAMLNIYGTRQTSIDVWLDSFKDRWPPLQSEHEQDNLVFVLYEAKAMSSQFNYYLGEYRICLVPLGGDPSIRYRWDLAKDIERCCDLFNKEPVICYFGDMDEKGSQIPVSAMADIRKWCRYPIEFHRLGINEEHVKQYNIPVDETGEKFQWEALNDATAHSLLDQVFQYWDKDVIARVKAKEQDGHDLWSSVVGDAIRKAKSC